MKLYDILQFKFPQANFLKDIILQDDGQGPYIAQWNIKDTPQPTDKDIQAWATDPEVIKAYQVQQNAILNAPIIEQLQKIDLQSIRPLREGDSYKLGELALQATTLRSQLLPTS